MSIFTKYRKWVVTPDYGVGGGAFVSGGIYRYKLSGDGHQFNLTFIGGGLSGGVDGGTISWPSLPCAPDLSVEYRGGNRSAMEFNGAGYLIDGSFGLGLAGDLQILLFNILPGVMIDPPMIYDLIERVRHGRITQLPSYIPAVGFAAGTAIGVSGGITFLRGAWRVSEPSDGWAQYFY